MTKVSMRPGVFGLVLAVLSIGAVNVVLAKEAGEDRDEDRAGACDLAAFGTPTTFVAGFKNPESVQPDRESCAWYSSNIGNQTRSGAFEVQTDGDGFIARIGADGTVNPGWFTGLGNPKGIRIWRGKLFVADVNRVEIIDIASATRWGTIFPDTAQVSHPTNLNDIAIDREEGTLYVSDRGTGPSATAASSNDVIWRVDLPRLSRAAPASMPTLTVFARMAAGSLPNGVLVDDDLLVVVDGPVGPAGALPGSLHRLDLETGAPAYPAALTSLTTLDGLEKDRDAYLVTQNGGAAPGVGKLARVTLDENGVVAEQILVIGTGEGAADIGYDRKTRTIALPHLRTSKVQFLSVDELPPK